MTARLHKFKDGVWSGVEEDLIRGLYLGLLGREPDAPGMLHWIDRLQAGDSLDSIVAEILQCDECYQRRRSGQFQQRYLRLCQSVADWSIQALVDLPLQIVDASVKSLNYEYRFYDQLNKYKVPYKLHAFGQLEYYRQKYDCGSANAILSSNIICDGKVHKFHMNEPDYVSSLLPFQSRPRKFHTDSSQYVTMRIESVQTHTLDSVLQDVDYIDLLRLNIQGLELLALQNAVQVLQRTQIVHCNVSFIDMYQGQSSFTDVKQFLSAYGFELVDLYDLRHHVFTLSPSSSSQEELSEFAAVFFRCQDANTPARSIMSQSLLALLGYHKPTLAALLADRLDPDEHSLARLFKK